MIVRRPVERLKRPRSASLDTFLCQPSFAHLAQLLARLPEHQGHLLTCPSFSSAERRDLALQPDDFERRALQQTPASFVAPLLSVSAEPAQRGEQHSLQSAHFTADDLGLYGTGKNIPLTCTCGQDIRFPTLSQAYSRFADGPSSFKETYSSSFSSSPSYQTSSSRSEQTFYSPL